MHIIQKSARRWLAAAMVGCCGALALAPAAAAADQAGNDGTTATAPPVRDIRVRAEDGLRFDLPRFVIEPGERVRLLVKNRDAMPHNLLITRPGAREEVVTQALALGAQGPTLNYVPKTDLVLWSTPLLDQEGAYTIEFTAPAEKGVYPYVCTFPGHGFVMYGAMYVGEEMPELAADENVPPAVREEARAAATPLEPVTRPKLYRYLMPDAGPAAIAVALPGEQNYVWDAGAVRIRYAWSGGFVDRRDGLGGENGREMQLPAELLGTVYYRSGSAYPIRIGRTEGAPSVRFRGYRLTDGIPEFHYEVDGVEVRERITAGQHGADLVRTFDIGPTRAPVFFVSEPDTGVQFKTSVGTWQGDVLRLTGAEARRFSVTMIRSEKERSTK